MALTATVLDALAECLASSDDLRAGVAAARRRHPTLSFTWCDASDMGGETPYRAYPGFDLYLVDGSGHCWHLTGDPQTATGVVLAEQRPKRVARDAG